MPKLRMYNHTWIAVTVLFACFGISWCQNHDVSSYECENVKKSDSLEVLGNNPGGRLLEIHIRHNLKGAVEIRDGDSRSDRVVIQVERTGPSEAVVDGITANQTLFDVGHGTVFVLQLDYIHKPTRVVTIVIGSAIAGAIFLTLASLLIWWYYRRGQPPFSPVHRHGISNGGAESRDRDSTLDNEEVLDECEGTTPVHRQNGGAQPVPPPPPPRRVDPTYMSRAEARGGHMNQVGSGMGSPGRGMSKGTVVALSVVTIVSVVYASCPLEANAKVVVLIPPFLRIDAVKIYFNRVYNSDVFSEKWLHKNATQLLVFDLEEALPTTNAPCTSNKKCPNAYIQNLAGCDAATAQCICQRGYVLDRGACVDIDECDSDVHACPLTATCQNQIGTYVCQCGYGFYGTRKSCIPCSTGCPPGTFEAHPCSNFGDRVCQECTKCKGSMYEARPCGATSDRECMHVAHPVLITREITTPTFLEGLKVEASDNLFLEDLHSTRNLETTYYVTDMTQASDFYWIRESGLEVNIGILNVHLIPEYEDGDHESDNKYMLGNPNNSEDKTKFSKIVRNHCRHPIPDYYSITLEVSRDRTTAAENFVCDSKNMEQPQCPAGTNQGDTFLHRTLNEACTKMGTFPEPLMPASNSIVCTANTPLLKDVFNQTFTTERPIKFPSKKCRTSESRCDQCLDQPRCKMLELFEQKCCQIDCYTLQDCKLSYSEECINAPVECAMGDAYRYTIQPVFQNIKQEFQCYIKHSQPEVLYQLFSFIQIPDKKYQTPKVYKTVYARDLNYESRGEYKADFVTVEHNTGLNLHDEFIMVGQEVQGSSKINYTVHSVKSEDDYKKKRVVVHEISHNIFVASAQFEKPFDYSTSSWVRNNDCNKNISKFKSIQKHYNADSQTVNVMTQNIKTPFKYFLKSVENPPYIRFTVPGNMSILPYYFMDHGPLLLTNQSLKAELELLNGRIWIIRISGKMSSCPAYLGVTINNRAEQEELFRYDVLVLCPAEFNLTFNVPNWGQHPDKTFDICLQDSKKTYNIFLTQMLFEQQRIETKPESIKMPRYQGGSITVFAVAGVVVLVCFLLLFIGFIYTENTKTKFMYSVADKPQNATSEYDDQTRDESGGSCIPNNQLDQSQTFFIGFYIAVRMVYTLIFTFTVFFAVLLLFIEGDFKVLSRLGFYQREKYNSSFAMSHSINQFGQDELLRQGELVTSMQGACSHYIGELFDTMAKQMDNITANQHLLELHGEESSISSFMHNRAAGIMEGYNRTLANFSAEYKNNISYSMHPPLNRYKMYLRQIFDDGWFDFPQRMFNQSRFAEDRPKVLREGNEKTGMVAGVEVDFGAFLEVEEVEEVQLWPLQYWERYENTLPVLPSLPVPKVDHKKPSCHVDPAQAANLSHRTALDQLDSARYFATHLPEEPSRGPKFTSTHIAEEYKFLPQSKDDYSNPLVFQVKDFVEAINTDILRIIFLVLDALLLIYRFSHTYINATMLCKGFEETSPFGLFKKQEAKFSAGKAEVPVVGGGGAGRSMQGERDMAYGGPDIPDYSAPLQTQGPHPKAGRDSSHSADGATHPKDTDSWSKWEHFKYNFSQVLLSDKVPKVLVAAALGVLFYILVKSVLTVLDIHVISSMDGFGVFLQTLDVQVNQTNWYLIDQSKHFNEVTMKIYESQMRSELLNLESMLEYFNTEQKRLIENYNLEACAVKKQLASNWTCDVVASPPLLDIPMLPCNFIPIQPQLYTSFQLTQYESELGRSFEPYLSAAREVVLKTGYAILVTVILMLLIHIGGALVFHYLKTRHKFPVRRVYLTSNPPMSGEVSHHPQDETDYDSEENEGGFRDYATPTRVRLSPEKSNTLLTDFRYSETKV